MKKIKPILSVFFALVLSITTLLSSTMLTLASDGNTRANFVATFPDEWESYTLPQKHTWVISQDFFKEADDFEKLNILSEYRVLSVSNSQRFDAVMQYLCTNSFGTVINNGFDGLKDIYQGVIEECENSDTDICNINSDGKLYLSDEYIALFKEALDAYVDANAPKFWIVDTTDYSKIPASAYGSKAQYDAVQSLLDSLSNCAYTFTNSTTTVTIDALDICDYSFAVTEPWSSYQNCYFYDSNWKLILGGTTNPALGVTRYVVDSSGAVTTTNNPAKIYAYNKFLIGTVDTSNYDDKTFYSPANWSFKGGKPIQVFNSRESAVNYLTNTSPVYQTIPTYTGGTVVIPENAFTFDYGAIYDSIFDAITDANTNSDNGLTAEQIQAMIDSAIAEALANLNAPTTGGNTGSGGSTSGTVSGGDSGSGSSGGGFLSSIGDFFGKILDFILSLVEKLFDPILKLLDMFMELINKVIDIIPTGFTSFLGAMFPFFPDEWSTIISLGLLASIIICLIFRRK